MGIESKIEWTDSTFNPWIGCTNISPGCDHCYAEQWARKYGVKWGDHPRHRTRPDNWKAPLKWNANGPAFFREHGRRQRVFCASLADVWDNQVPPPWRSDLLKTWRETPNLDWLIVTKRPQQIVRQCLQADDWFESINDVTERFRERYPNVWLGFTAEDQEHYDQRWPFVARINAVIRFVSYEPAIGPLSVAALDREIETLPDWIIDGGESSPAPGITPRVMRPAWSRQLRDECQAHGIAYFKKQWGSWASNPLVQEQGMWIVEAKAIDTHGKGGEMLDGVIWREFPRPDMTRPI